jgi:hypothetical protein
MVFAAKVAAKAVAMPIKSQGTGGHRLVRPSDQNDNLQNRRRYPNGALAQSAF